MKLESPNFTTSDVEAFLEALVDEERLILIDRLRAAARRARELAPRVKAETGADAGWSAHEVLAHMAVLAKFYGVLTYQIGSGKLTELDLLANVNLRDVAGQQMAAETPGTLADSLATDLERTIAYLEKARPADLARSAQLTHGGSMTAGEVARLPLCAHLEQHLRQLEAALS
ncbi:MAG TPA: DinB family protein [Candidatus Dormibacteraeota bacterium]